MSDLLGCQYDWIQVTQPMNTNMHAKAAMQWIKDEDILWGWDSKMIDMLLMSK